MIALFSVYFAWACPQLLKDHQERSFRDFRNRAV